MYTPDRALGLCNAAATAAAGTTTLYPVLSAVNDFHAALALAFTRKWRESGATITRMGHIMQEVIPPLCKRPEQAFAMLIEADKVKRISSSISSSASTATSFSKY
jgi:tRNA G26 N,N-dimethylase Trm1